MSEEIPWESWFHKEHAIAGGLLTENYLLRKQIEELKASAVPKRDRINQHIGNPGVAPSAVPEEIAEVVRRLRRISPNHRYADCMGSDEVACIQKAADLLEGYVRQSHPHDQEQHQLEDNTEAASGQQQD